MSVQVVLQPDPFVRAHPIKVRVHHGRTSIKGLDQVERWGADLAVMAERFQQAADKRRFPGPQGAIEHKDVAGCKASGKGCADGPRLLFGGRYVSLHRAHAETIPFGYGEDVDPGPETLPIWVQRLAPVVLVALIIIGGLWLQRMEKKARKIEKERAQWLSEDYPRPEHDDNL